MAEFFRACAQGILPACALFALACGEVRDADPDAGGGEVVDAGGDGGEGGDGGDENGAPAASAEHSTISGEDGAIADGEDIAEITIELLDDSGAPVAGVTPEFEASGDGNAYEPCSATGDDGIATCGMTSTEGGEKTLQLTAPVERTGETIDFLLVCEEDGAPFGGGDGSEDDPYRLCSPEQLNRVGDGDDFLEDAFIVARDLDMSGQNDFNVIGVGPGFSGRFDGGGRVISNLSIIRPDGSYLALIGHATEEAEIAHVRLEDIDFRGDRNSFAGGLVGFNQGTIVGAYVSGEIENDRAELGGLVGDSRGSIADSRAEVDVTGQSFNVGGLVGFNTGPISNSHATGDVVSEGDSIAGLAGFNDAEISDSSASGNVTCVEEDCNQIGGLVGNNGGVIRDSHATGDVEAVGGASGDFGSSYRSFGGLVGRHAGEIVRSYATGNVLTADANGVGGLSGTSGVISDSFATGEVTSEGEGVGGLVGAQFEEIRNSYATGAVTGGDKVGGLVGEQSALLRDSYSTGAVSGEGQQVGGLVGESTDAVVDSFWDEETSIGESDGGTPLSTDDFGDEESFPSSWNFAEIWTIGEAPDGETRPILQWQE